MGEASTDTLRQLAPKWSLAGDDTLLTILQNTHQKIVSKCHEVNTKLEEMVSSLDDASIHQQNVNNKFMSLSNRQFIESRVYDDDDDADLTMDTQTNKESPQPSLPDELSILKNSLAILDAAHEITEIMDDSDSDSDAEISVVLKPKDMYSSRPLPYIIGSQQWKNKWHAGLIIENSDEESIQSKENTDVEYSEESDIDEQTDRQIDNTISESSSLQSDLVPVSNRHTAAQVAANIANVMAQTQPIIERPITPPTPKEFIPKKPPTVYKPQQPITSTVFPDEPPPLDQYDSDSSEHDIFAEINKNNITNNNKINNVADDLFGFGDNSAYSKGNRNAVNELFGNSDDEEEPQPVKQKSPVIQQQSEALVTQKPVTKEQEENISKKPIGGISLFGSNKNTDTIGAAILKRNLRRSSTSEESGSEDVKTETFKQKTENKQNLDEIDNKVAPKKENKDIFEDLFSKNDKKVQKGKEKDEKTLKNEIKKKENDLFSDNIFDDVDDIFSSNVKVTSKTAQPSLFDSDDDMFSNIAKPKTMQPSTSKETNPKTVEKLFESDDDLFSDLKSTKTDTNTKKGAAIEKKSTKIDFKTTKEKASEEKLTIKEAVTKKVSTKIDDTKVTEIKSTVIDQPSIKVTENIIKTKSIFDSDSDDDIFNFNKPTTQKSSIETSSAKSLKADVKKFQSPSLFDDDEFDDLLNISKNNANTVPSDKNKPNANIATESNQQSNFDSTSNTLESKSQHNFDKNIINTHTIVVIEKDALKINEEGSKSIEVTVKRTITDINIQDPYKIDEEKDALNRKEEILISKEDKSEYIAKSNDPEILQSTLKDERLDIKNVENVNVPKETLEKPFSSETNENEHLTEAATIQNVQENNDCSPEAQENLIKETFDDQSVINKDLHSQKVLENLTESVIKEQIFNDHDNKDVPIPNETIPQVAKIPEIVPTVALLDDILTEPPVFEKAKEPKKSKNVNALFDDDSEDEALFFKRNDVISDVKPDIFSNKANFGLFIDEPPAIDDFDNDLFSKHDEKVSVLCKNDGSENTDITTAVNDQIHDSEGSFTKNYGNQDFDTGLFNKNDENHHNPINDEFHEDSDPKIVHNYENLTKFDDSDRTSQESKLISDNIIKTDPPKENLFQDSSDEEIFTEKLPELPEKSDENSKIKTKITETKTLFDDLDDNLFTNKITNTDTNISNQEKTKKSTQDIKKIGKLNTQNININVQALMPGASPRKVKIDTLNTEPKPVEIESKEAEDSETSVPGIPEPNVSEINQPKMVKSISFEDSPDTDVLDNNVSKKRAKIQVKRRPSSRKARHEAVRKSVIDTDKDLDINERSLDINKESLVNNEGFLDIDKQSIDTENTIEYISKIDRMMYKDSDIDKDLLDIGKQVLDTDKIIAETTDYVEQNKTVTKLDLSLKNTVKIDNNSDYYNDITESISKLNENKSSKNETQLPEKSTKIVYVLNDEDIFQSNKNASVKTSTKIETESTKIKKESTKKEAPKSLFDNEQSEGDTSIKTEKDQINNEKTKTKISLFDSDEEEDKSLFKAKPIVKKTKLFDSDSDEDLFRSAKTKTVKTKETVMKKSLFDDENDDEIFGAKNNKLDKKSAPSTSKESSKKSIFADPLTLFGDDD